MVPIREGIVGRESYFGGKIMLNNGIFEIRKEVAERLLAEKERISVLSYPARRVLYSGRGTGRWYTKSKSVYDEILSLYSTIDGARKKVKAAKNKKSNESEELPHSLGVSEEELKNFLTLLERLLVRKG